MYRGIAIVVVAVPMLASACYNDRDTLGYELNNKPDLQRALTGHFDRFPPLYFQMRIDRLRSKPHLTPEEYDDLSVAYGRLGKNDEALQALTEKAKIHGLTTDQQYRLFANRGTIRAHKWIHDGGSANTISLLLSARDDIAKAIKINPKAHFGREGAQLETIKWLIDLKTGNHGKPIESLGERIFYRLTNADPTLSLSGLIMLGGAWESPDIALAISLLQYMKHRPESARLALLRYQELIHLGKKPIDKDVADDAEDLVQHFLGQEYPDPTNSTSARFATLRAEADTWLANKTSYTLDQLRQGKHPDTNPDFWANYHEAPMTKLPTKKNNLTGNQIFDYVVAGSLIIFVPSMYLLWSRSRRLRALKA
jgi:hypothetical protein